MKFSMKLNSLFAAVAVLAVSACSSLKPRDVSKDDTSNLMVAFDAEAMGDLAKEMDSLQVRVFKMVANARSTMELDKNMKIELQKKQYEISGVKLGKKEIEVAIHDAAGQVLGVGTISHLVTPGANVTDALTIKIKKLESPLTDVAIELDITGDVALVEKAVLTWKTEKTQQGDATEVTLGGSAGPTIPAAVQLTLKKRCQGCHNSNFDQAGIDLDMSAFPYTASGYEFEELMDLVEERMTDADSPMPPSGILKDDQLKPVLAWKQSLGATDGPEATTLQELQIADKITGEIVLTGADGVELHKAEIEAYSIEKDGVLKISIELKVEDSTIAIPINVEQE
jgi:mono/diheme cytochrome c family protein